MKKFILAFTVVLCIVLMLSSCAENANNSSFPDNSTDSFTSSDSGSSNSEIEMVGSSGIIEYLTFEETLLRATDIMTATYTGKYEKRGIYYDLIFTPDKQIKGAKVNENIYVTISEGENIAVEGKGIHYTVRSSAYKEGTKYLLILEKRVSVYKTHDIYMPFSNTIIAENKLPTMYNSQHIENYSTGETKGKDFNSVVAYVEDFNKKNKDTSKVFGFDYIRSDNIPEIVSKTSIIAEVVPIEPTGSSENNNTEWYLCKVENVLKGSVEEKNIRIIFIADTVEIGKKYIAMIEKRGEFIYYTLSSRSSVHPIASKTAEEIKSIIKQ